MSNNGNVVGKCFTHSKYGEYEVMEYISWDKVKILFKNTGGTSEVRFNHARDGLVRDSEYPTVYGVGVKGSAKISVRRKAIKSYKIWSGILKRCYGKDSDVKYPTYVGCSMCDEWKYFPNFREWFDANYIEGFELDKDTVIEGNRVYSPNTCVFISHKENAQHCHSNKMYKSVLLSPEGEEVLVYNQSQFCGRVGLDRSKLNAVINGKRISHKGWKFIRKA